MFADITGNPTDGFYVTMLDQYTKWAAASQVVHKSPEDVLEFVSATVEMLETQTGCRLKCFRTDKGREFDNHLVSLVSCSTHIVWRVLSSVTFVQCTSVIPNPSVP